MTYISTKTYGHEIGLSCAFRQWRADSHCKYLHGYSLAFTFRFMTERLDHRNWVVDFGGLRDLKTTLEGYFDHKTIVSEDDPHMKWFERGQDLGVLDLIVVDNVGCEKFAELAYNLANEWLEDNDLSSRVTLLSVEAKEHGSNTAIYSNEF